MKIEVGKFYKMRNGETVGPLEKWDTCFSAPQTVEIYVPLWNENGTEEFFVEGYRREPKWDLVEEVNDQEP